MMVTQELVANAMNDESRQAFKEEKRRIASQKKATQATSTNQPSIDRSFVSTDRSFVSTDSSNTPNASAASTSTGANANESSFVYLRGKILIDASTLPNADLPIDLNMPDLEDASDTLPNDGIFNGAYDDDEDVGAVADFNNMDNTIAVSPIPTLRIHKDHPKGQILGDPTSAVQTRGKIQKASSAQQALVKEPKTISQDLKDESWVETMQEELLQFKLQQVWILMDLPFGKKAISTKWVFRNKRDKRSIVVKNKARLVAQGHRQEEGIDYDEVFAPVARIEAIRLFLAFASYMGFLVYQMDVKSAFLYGTTEEEVYVHQPPGFVDPTHSNKVYKVVKAVYGLHQAPRAWYETLSSFLLENGFRRGTIDKTLFIKKNKSDIISYAQKIPDEFHGRAYVLFGTTATTPIESNKPLVKDEDGVEFWTTAKSRTVNNISYIDATVVGKPVTISEASIRSDLLFDDADGIDSLNNQAIFDNIQLMGPSPSIAIPDSNPEDSGGNHGAQAKEIKALKAQVKKLKKGVKPLITHHKSWMKSVALKTRLARKTSVKKKGYKKNPAFDDLDDDAIDYMETEDAQDEGRTSFVMLEEKESADKEVSTEAPVSTVKPNEGTDKRNKGTDKQDGGTDSTKVSTDRQGEGTADQNEGKNATQTAPTTTSTPTPTIFGDDETIAQVLITMSQNKQKEKEKGVEIRNAEDTERPRPTSTRSILTLRPLPKIDPKDKGKKRIEEEDESDTEPEDITEAERGKKKIFFFKIKQKIKGLLMMKRWPERFKWSGKLKRRRKVLYEKMKRSDDSFIAIGSAEDAKMIKEMNEQAAYLKKTLILRDCAEALNENFLDYFRYCGMARACVLASETLSRNGVGLAQLALFGGGMYFELLVYIPEASALGFSEVEGPLLVLPVTWAFSLLQVQENFSVVPYRMQNLYLRKGLFELGAQQYRKKTMEQIIMSRDDIKEEKKRLAEEEATNAELSNEYDFIQARLNADKILAEKLQEEEKEMYTIEQRTKFLHDTIAAQRRFLAQQRSEAIRNKPPSRNQLRNQMMTYLKHVGGKKHSDLKTKSFDEIQVLYEKIKRSDDSFIAIGFAKNEKVIKEMNEQASDASKKRVKKDDSILDKKYPIIEWRSEYLKTKPQHDETEEIEEVYLNVVIRSNRQRIYFSTLMAVLSILDRDDICAIYQLVMNRYQDETPEGFEKILWEN
ncbi:putative ribonuclease H-like domain-containing protein [Tanacetum coccineum]